GGILGVNARYWLGLWMNRWVSAQFPWATFAINVSGSFAIGFLTVALTRWLPHPHVRLLVLTGFLGGYTTFSTLAYESATLWERGEAGLALVNLIGSVAAGFAAVLLGIGLARGLTLPAPERSIRAGRPGSVAGVRPPQPLRSVGDEPVDPDVEPFPPEADALQGEDDARGTTHGRLR
ncbi:MAG: fluoride efflux transporter CrcB, partial [Isosphaeraceae bacterium]|nr:fluoride efflux transporter CrcB [Isosphaeraceae bacterium]